MMRGEREGVRESKGRGGTDKVYIQQGYMKKPL
jgi:hypothetical protein